MLLVDVFRFTHFLYDSNYYLLTRVLDYSPLIVARRVCNVWKQICSTLDNGYTLGTFSMLETLDTVVSTTTALVSRKEAQKERQKQWTRFMEGIPLDRGCVRLLEWAMLENYLRSTGIRLRFIRTSGGISLNSNPQGIPKYKDGWLYDGTYSKQLYIWFAEKGCVEGITWLMEHGVIGSDATTIMMTAAANNHLPVMEVVSSSMNIHYPKLWEITGIAAAKNGNSDIVKWITEKEPFLVTNNVVYAIIQNASLDFELFKWVIDQIEICPCLPCWNDSTAALRIGVAAAEAGNMPVLKWLHSMFDCKDFNGNTFCDSLAKYGNLSMLEWGVTSGYGITSKAYNMAAAGGHLQILQWLKDSNICEWSDSAWQDAIENGHLEALQWLLQDDLEQVFLEHSICKAAADNKQWHIVRWAIDTGFERIDTRFGRNNSSTLLAIVGSGDACLVRHVLTHYAIIDDTNTIHDTISDKSTTWLFEDIWETAIDAANPDILEVVAEYIKCPPHKDVVCQACRVGSVPCLLWLLKQGYEVSATSREFIKKCKVLQIPQILEFAKLKPTDLNTEPIAIYQICHAAANHPDSDDQPAAKRSKRSK